MKVLVSFLFFCIALLNVNSSISAQEVIDSTEYYKEILSNPKTKNDLTKAKAYSFFEDRIKENLQKADTLSAIRSLRSFAINQFDSGLFYESEISSVRSLELAENLQINAETNEIKTGVYNQLGKIYRILKNTDQALDYYKKALSYEANSRDSITIINNIANIHRDQKLYDLAINEFSFVVEKRKQFDDREALLRALDNLNYTRSKIDDPEALNGLLNVLEERIKDKDTKGIFSSNRHIAYYYLDRNNKKEARKYVEKTYELAKLLNSSSYLKEALSLMVALNDDPKILEYKKLTDSLADEKLQQENKFAAIKFNIGEEKKRTQEAELLKEKERGLKRMYQAIAIFILLLLIASYFIYKVKYKKGKIEQIYKTETRIAQKVHDEVANDVYHVMTKIQADATSNNEVLDDLENIYSKTRDISKENSALEVHHNFETLLNDLLVSYKTDHINVITRNLNKIYWSKISDNKKTAIYRVLQELMTNMKKHSRADFVVLAFKQTYNKVEIEYNDNGVGCEIKKQNGLQNVENRINTLAGKITFTSQNNHGFNVKITI
jgi:signal transduction histidine kinase